MQEDISPSNKTNNPMKKIEITEELKSVKEICSAINRLLDIPAGEQIYRRQLNLLFDSLELVSKPIYISGDDKSWKKLEPPQTTL